MASQVQVQSRQLNSSGYSSTYAGASNQIYPDSIAEEAKIKKRRKLKIIGAIILIILLLLILIVLAILLWYFIWYLPKINSSSGSSSNTGVTGLFYPKAFF